MFREDKFLFKFGSEGCNTGQFNKPCYIAIDSSDQVYVTDQCNDGGISVFSEDGHFIKGITYNKSFIICIAPDDHMMATVNDHNKITVFSPTHECIAKFGVHGEEKGQFTSITGIAINNSGSIFVIEYGNIRLQIIRT